MNLTTDQFINFPDLPVFLLELLQKSVVHFRVNMAAHYVVHVKFNYFLFLFYNTIRDARIEWVEFKTDLLRVS